MNKAILQANAGTPIQVAVLPTPSASLTGLVYHLTSDDKYYVVANGEWKVLSVDDYNMLKNLPIINQDLDATGFVGIEGAYYRHIGSSTNEGLVPGTIYRYQNDEFKELGAGNGGSSVGMPTLVGTLEKPLTVADFEFGIEYLVQGYLLFGNVNEDHIMFNIADASGMGRDGGPSYTNGSIVLKQKGKKEENQDTWQHYLVIRNTYVSSVNEGGMTFNILPYEGFYFTVSFRSTEEGKTGESFGLTFTQAGFPFVNGAIGGIGFDSIQPVPDEENAFMCGFYAPTEPGEEGQVLGAVESGHFAPTWKDPAIKTLDLSKIKTISGNYYKHIGDGTKSFKYNLTPLGTLPNDKYRANTFIIVGNSFRTIYFNQNVTPNPTELDWSSATTDSNNFENIELITFSDDKVMFSRKLINGNYEYSIRINDGTLFWIGEGTIKDALTDQEKAEFDSRGWKGTSYYWSSSKTVTAVNQQDIWNSYLSQYSNWYTYRSNFYVNTEIIPDRSTFILDNNDSIDDTHYIFYGDCGYMNAYETDGSSISLYVTFFEIYTDYNKTNLLYYGLSLGNYNNHLQYILYANTTTNQEPSVAGLTQWGWQYSKGSPILLEYSWGNSYDGMTSNWQNFFSEDDRWATPQDIQSGKIYYCDENEALVPLATNNDIQSLVGNINTLLESIDTGAGV